MQSRTYTLGHRGGIAVATAVATAFAFQFLGSIGPSASATLQAIGAGALIAMAAETMIPEAFADAQPFIGLITVVGFLAAFLIIKLPA